jgi:hypothetical protein
MNDDKDIYLQIKLFPSIHLHALNNALQKIISHFHIAMATILLFLAHKL